MYVSVLWYMNVWISGCVCMHVGECVVCVIVCTCGCVCMRVCESVFCVHEHVDLWLCVHVHG